MKNAAEWFSSTPTTNQVYIIPYDKEISLYSVISFPISYFYILLISALYLLLIIELIDH